DAATDRVVPCERVDLQRVAGVVAAGNLHFRGEAGDEHVADVGAQVDVVGVRGPVDNHRVWGFITGTTASDSRQVDVGMLEVGTGGVVDGDRVRPTERVQRETLDAAQVQRDRGDIARQSHP